MRFYRRMVFFLLDSPVKFSAEVYQRIAVQPGGNCRLGAGDEYVIVTGGNFVLGSAKRFAEGSLVTVAQYRRAQLSADGEAQAGFVGVIGEGVNHQSPVGDALAAGVNLFKLDGFLEPAFGAQAKRLSGALRILVLDRHQVYLFVKVRCRIKDFYCFGLDHQVHQSLWSLHPGDNYSRRRTILWFLYRG